MGKTTLMQKIKFLLNFSLPWWCKLVANILSGACMFTAAFFIIVKGITMGQEQVNNWLVSLVFSFLTSAFITQTLKVK